MKFNTETFKKYIMQLFVIASAFTGTYIAFDQSLKLEDCLDEATDESSRQVGYQNAVMTIVAFLYFIIAARQSHHAATAIKDSETEIYNGLKDPDLQTTISNLDSPPKLLTPEHCTHILNPLASKSFSISSSIFGFTIMGFELARGFLPEVNFSEDYNVNLAIAMSITAFDVASTLYFGYEEDNRQTRFAKKLRNLIDAAITLYANHNEPEATRKAIAKELIIILYNATRSENQTKITEIANDADFALYIGMLEERAKMQEPTLGSDIVNFFGAISRSSRRVGISESRNRRPTVGSISNDDLRSLESGCGFYSSNIDGPDSPDRRSDISGSTSPGSSSSDGEDSTNNSDHETGELEARVDSALMVSMSS